MTPVQCKTDDSEVFEQGFMINLWTFSDIGSSQLGTSGLRLNIGVYPRRQAWNFILSLYLHLFILTCTTMSGQSILLRPNQATISYFPFTPQKHFEMKININDVLFALGSHLPNNHGIDPMKNRAVNKITSILKSLNVELWHRKLVSDHTLFFCYAS